MAQLGDHHLDALLILQSIILDSTCRSTTLHQTYICIPKYWVSSSTLNTHTILVELKILYPWKITYCIYKTHSNNANCTWQHYVLQMAAHLTPKRFTWYTTYTQHHICNASNTNLHNMKRVHITTIITYLCGRKICNNQWK